ncbi:MAG TPA: molybdopterin-dependent oxidoreductase [Candidatus Acidoferrum sp.]|nr:molybdopterin-dependent oxidoreductase [Candidatus Acidoferrum sp.]
MSLTVVGSNGTQVVLNETDVGSLMPYRAYGGYKNSLGNLRGLGNYTGVRLSTLCDLVGGLTDENVVRITASDTYSMNLTYAQINGEFVTYDNITGAQVPHSQPLVPIAAYYFNDVSIGSSDGGPLRLAIVGPEGLLTDGTFWVKWMIKIEILKTVPELPSSSVLPLLIIMTLAVAVSLKVHSRRHDRLKQFGRLASGCVVYGR